MFKRYLLLMVVWLVTVSGSVLASERAEEGWHRTQSGALLVDVRTPGEFNSGHIEGAVNYPLSQLDTYFEGVDKNQSIVLYCRSGNRSGQAYQWLNARGFTNVHNAGGLNEMLSAKPLE